MARPQKIDDEQLLDRAMALFWQQGWSATSIRQLEDELDLRAPSIYRRFGSKDGLVQAVLERYLERIIGRRIARYLSGEGDPIDNIWSFLDSALTPSGVDQPLLGCLLTVTALDRPTPSSELGRILARGLAEIEAALVREFERAAELGRLADGLDPAAAAAQVDLAFHGLMVLARGGRPPSELRGRAARTLGSVTAGVFDPRSSTPRSPTPDLLITRPAT